MKSITLGSTGITAPQNGFGCLPIQRDDVETAAKIVRKAYEGGMRFFDTARAYTDSEIKVGIALEGIDRSSYYLATKTEERTVEGFWKELHESLTNLKTDYVDIYQLHMVDKCYKPNDGTGLYEAMLQAKQQGLIRHIGITTHKCGVAKEIIESGLYETLQYPLSYLAGDIELELIEGCKKANMGFIAMKGLAGGLLTNSKACFAYMSQFDNVMPIWGIQRETELNEWLSFFDEPAILDDEMIALIENDKKQLGSDFCRGCNYCAPCSVDIKIFSCARMSQMIRRSPSASWLSPEWQAEMNKINDCIECGACMSRCPYGLNIPSLLRKNLEDYNKIISGEIKI